MTHSTGELVVTQHAIDTIAGAYEQAAGELRDLSFRFKHTYGRTPWGTLPSILQLQKQYEDLAISENASAVARLIEFSDIAERLASWVRESGAALLDADHSTATSLSESELQ